MKAVALLFAAMLLASAARGQGQFLFSNRVLNEGVDARFVLPTDPSRTSSVGTDFQAQLFGGPEGTPLEQLIPVEPPSAQFRGPAGTATAGYAGGRTHDVPGVGYATET